MTITKTATLAELDRWARSNSCRIRVNEAPSRRWRTTIRRGGTIVADVSHTDWADSVVGAVSMAEAAITTPPKSQ